MSHYISPKSIRWGDLAVRAVSALVLIPTVLFFDWLGAFWFHMLMLFLGWMVAREWTRIVHPQNVTQYVLHVAAAFAGVLIPRDFGVGYSAAAILALAIVSVLLARSDKTQPTLWSYSGVLYIGFPAMALVTLRDDPNYGALAILWIFVIVWSADIMAYFAGRIIGGPKLAPSISPKKTWAGLGGAIFGSALASTVFMAVTELDGMVELAILAGLLAIIEQAGDLFESALKRCHNVKDSGRLIPGHGGIIDRIDGLVAVAVVAALIGIARWQHPTPAQGLLLW